MVTPELISFVKSEFSLVGGREQSRLQAIHLDVILWWSELMASLLVALNFSMQFSFVDFVHVLAHSQPWSLSNDLGGLVIF